MNDFVVFEIFACGFDLYRRTLHVSMIDRFLSQTDALITDRSLPSYLSRSYDDFVILASTRNPCSKNRISLCARSRYVRIPSVSTWFLLITTSYEVWFLAIVMSLRSCRLICKIPLHFSQSHGICLFV